MSVIIHYARYAIFVRKLVGDPWCLRELYLPSQAWGAAWDEYKRLLGIYGESRVMLWDFKANQLTTAPSSERLAGANGAGSGSTSATPATSTTGEWADRSA